MTGKKGKNVSHETETGFGAGLGGIMKGLADLVEKLGELAEKGEELSKAGEIQGKKGVKGVYGFTVKVGLGDQGIKVEPFGNVRTDKRTGQAEVQEIREPMADVFEEKGFVLVVAEMPGIGAQDVRIDLRDDVLAIAAERGDKKYRKEILLPGNFSPDKMTVACNNGVVEIKLLR
ncbi:MAG: Hsp20/alpha crystallin family protein [Deltaproteobacteria bacterium]|nr:Hsp20/alpha crystallin family protein [Deltaproteobacteria bacterium]